jgi:hypothetical protein
MAARQALSLCETELRTLTWDTTSLPPSTGISRQHSRVSGTATRAALRAAGVPPRIAALLRHRLRLIPEAEDTP